MYVNKIVKVEAMCDGWKVEARTPDGMRVVLFGAESAEQTMEDARWAEAEPA